MDQFLKSSGSAGPFRIVLEGPAGPEAEAREFHQPYLIVGRDPGTDLVLDHPDVSRRHAYLQLVGGRPFCVDLASRTGTHWPGGRNVWGWMDPLDGIQVGPYRIRRLSDDPSQPDDAASTSAEPLPTSRAFSQSDLPELGLELLDAVAQPSRCQISRAVVLLGRSPVCRLQLTGPEVSRVHASLVRTPAGAWAIDLGGRGGLLINGRRVRCARLETDDELQIGTHRFRVQSGPVAPSPTALAALPAGPPVSDWDRPTSLVAADVLQGVGDPALGALLREFGQMQQNMADQFQQALLMMFRMFTEMNRDQIALIREEMAQIHRLSETQRDLQAKLTANAPNPIPEARTLPEPPRATASRPEPPWLDRPRPSSPPREPAQNANDFHAALIQRIESIQRERQGRWQKLLGSVIGRGTTEGTL